MTPADTARLQPTRHAHQQGAQAYNSGQQQSANPYPERTQAHWAWVNGWQFAQTLAHSPNLKAQATAALANAPKRIDWITPNTA